MALGFGSVTNTTVLGQPLAFAVPLRMDADEFVSVECVFAEVHAGDVRVPPSQVRVSLDPPRDGGERVLRITTTALIDEPVINIEVGLGCPVRLSRKFVAFVDPPVISLAQAPTPEAAPQHPSATEATAAQPPSAAVIATPPAARVAGPRTTPAPKAVQRRPARPVARPSVIDAPTVAPTPRARSQEPRAKVAPAAPATAGGARLKLEAAEAPARAPMPLAAASVPATESSPATVGATEASAAVAAAAAASAADSQQARELERMRLLEESLVRLRTETEATRSSVATLHARLREAEASRYANPLVYGLVALVLLMLLAMAMMLLWVRARDRQRADWWAASAEEAAAARQRPAAPAVGAPLVYPPPPDSVSSAAVVDSLPAPAGAVTWKPTLAIPELDKNEAPKRAVTAEELIDLEQQAEFFITLGQDDSAIDLLVGHLNSSGGISPLPYLKLMEIHRRRGDLSAYERIREHFNQRFNAYAPAGDAYVAPARTLDEHPDVMAQLQEAWPTPARAMGLLESLLFKSGGRDAAFDLAAYREVLFLHEVARDLYEHDSSPSTVDVLLPLDTQAAALAANPLMTTMSVPANPDFGRSSAVVDLDLGRPRDEEAEAAAARAERRKERYGDGDFLFGSNTGGEWDQSEPTGKDRGRKGSK
jgi:pilus assembly protein FimV